MRLHRPTTLDAVHKLLRDHPRAALMAGGQFAIPGWFRDGPPADVIGLEHVSELRRIALEGNEMFIGAAATHRELSESPMLQQYLPGLAGLAVRIGDWYLRNRATIGGALFTTGHAGCYPAALIGLGACIVTTSREIPAEAWFSAAAGHTPMENGEFVVGLRIPIARLTSHHFVRLVPGRFALVTLFAAIGDGIGLRLGVSGFAERAFRAPAAEAWLGSRTRPDPTPAQDLWGHAPREDERADARYRLAVAAELLRRVGAELA